MQERRRKKERKKTERKSNKIKHEIMALHLIDIMSNHMYNHLYLHIFLFLSHSNANVLTCNIFIGCCWEKSFVDEKVIEAVKQMLSVCFLHT